MIVDNAYIVGVSVPEAEDDAKLFVNPDAIEASPITFEGFQTVLGRHTQITQVMRRIQYIELPYGNTLQGRRQYCARSLGVDPVEKVFGGAVSEAGNHARNVSL
jgi:hypothetical protein